MHIQLPQQFTFEDTLPTPPTDDGSDLLNDCTDLLDLLSPGSPDGPPLKKQRFNHLDLNAVCPIGEPDSSLLPSPTWPTPGFEGANDFGFLLSPPKGPRSDDLSSFTPPMLLTPDSSTEDTEDAEDADDDDPSTPESSAPSISAEKSSPTAKTARKTSLPWTTEEDDNLRVAVAEHGAKKWSAVAAKVGSRSGKQCRLRWCNQIDPRIRRDAWTDYEDNLIIAERTRDKPRSWVEIAKLLPGRPDNAIKNRWNGCLIRRASGESGRAKSRANRAAAGSPAGSAPASPPPSATPSSAASPSPSPAPLAIAAIPVAQHGEQLASALEQVLTPTAEAAPASLQS